MKYKQITTIVLLILSLGTKAILAQSYVPPKPMPIPVDAKHSAEKNFVFYNSYYKNWIYANTLTFAKTEDWINMYITPFSPAVADAKILAKAFRSPKFSEGLQSFDEIGKLENFFSTCFQLFMIEDIQGGEDVIIPAILKKSQELGILNISTTPVGAYVKIDGYSGFGSTVLKTWVEKGTRKIELHLEGYKPIMEFVDIKALKFNKIERTLEPLVKK